MDSSKAPVVILIAIILMGVTVWVVWAVRTSGGMSPERKETLAKEAERECVLQGFPPEVCPELVGEHHRECLEAIPEDPKQRRYGEEAYIDCMLESFGDPQDYRDVGATADDEAREDAGSMPPDVTGASDDARPGDAAAEKPD